MALYQRRETSGRTRFLLALSLSTVTALGVAAPLAIQAVNADEVNFASGNPNAAATAEQADDDFFSGERANRRLSAHDAEAKGGIGSRIPAKAQSQTSKSETDPSAPRTEESVLTNPTTTTTEATTTTSTTSSTETTTTTQPPDDTTTTTDSTTTTSSTTTSTTDPDSTTTTTAPATTTSTTSADDPTTSSTGRP